MIEVVGSPTASVVTASMMVFPLLENIQKAAWRVVWLYTHISVTVAI